MLNQALVNHTPVFFNLFAAEEPSANVRVTHGTLCNDPRVYNIPDG